MSFMDFFKKKDNSSDVAKERIKLMLVSDRASCSPETMEQMKNDIIQVISKYVEIDIEGLDIQITKADGDSTGMEGPALCANIPIKKIKNTGK